MALSKQGDDDVMREMTSAKSVKEDAALLLAPYMNFEEFLVPAPISICVLGDLMLVATETDFDLSKSPPQGGFKLLRHPKSFRACLVQVANDGYRAFNKAHTNMDKIRLQTIETPNHLRSALKILFEGSLYDIADMLPIQLNAMKNSAEDCLRYAKETEEAFDLLMRVTAELQECCFSTQGHYEEELRKTEAELESTRLQIEGLRADKAMNDKIRLKLEEAMNRAEEDYRKALDGMPSGWELFKTQAWENASNTLSGVLNCATLALPAQMMRGQHAVLKGLTLLQPNIKHVADTLKGSGANKNATSPAGAAVKDAAKAQAQTHAQEEFTFVLDDELITSCAKATSVQSKAEYLFTAFVNKDSTLNSSQFNEEAKNKIAHCMGFFQTTRTELSKYGGEIAREVTKLCSGWHSVCSDLKMVVETMKMDAATGNDITERMTQLHTDALKVGSEAQAMMKNAQFETRLPFQEKARSSQGNKDEKSAKELAAEGAKVKLAQTSETLKHTRDNYDKACARAQETRKELREFRAKTTKLQTKKVDFDAIKEILKEGILTFAKLRDQWAKLVQFFQMTSNIIDVCLNKSVKKLVDEVEVSAERSKSVAGYTMSDLRKDMIYQQAFQAAKVSYVVNMESTSYVQVSQKHVMSRIAGLSRLLSYNPQTQKAEIESARRELGDDLDAAQEEILQIVLENKRKFDQTVEEKLKKLAQALPPTSDTERIQAAVRQGITRGEETPILRGITQESAGDQPGPSGNQPQVDDFM